MLTEDILAKTVGADPLDIQSTFVGAVCRWQAANPAGLIDITRFWYEQGSLDNEKKVARAPEVSDREPLDRGRAVDRDEAQRSERRVRRGQRRRRRGRLVGEPADAGHRRVRDGDQADGADARDQLLSDERCSRGTCEARPGSRRPTPTRSSRSHGSPVRSTAMADVGNFVEMRSAALALLPSAVARPSATADIAGSWPITNSVSTSVRSVTRRR